MNKLGFDSLARLVATRMTRRTATKAAVPALAAALGMSTHLDWTSAQSATPGATPAADRIRVRRSASSLSSDEKRAFVNALLTIKATPSPWTPSISIYDQFVLWHREAFDCAIMAAHMGPAFLPWHRAYLLLFEDQLRAVDPSLTLPYWDWTVDNQPDSAIWQDDFMGGNGDPDDGFAVTTGPFRKGAWDLVIFDYNDPVAAPYIVRDLGAGLLAGTLPTSTDVMDGLAIPSYDTAPWSEVSDPATSFRNYVEGWRDCAGDMCTADPFNHPACSGSHDMHNRVHLWVSGEFEFAHQGLRTRSGPFGTMAFNSAPNDPIFFLHHSNLDRIWSAWIARYGAIYEPDAGAMIGHNADDMMWPYTEIGAPVSPRMMLSDDALGYAYDVLP